MHITTFNTPNKIVGVLVSTDYCFCTCRFLYIANDRRAMKHALNDSNAPKAYSGSTKIPPLPFVESLAKYCGAVPAGSPLKAAVTG